MPFTKAMQTCQSVPLKQHTSTRVLKSAPQPKIRTPRVQALGGIDVAGTASTSAQLQETAQGVDGSVYVGLGLLVLGFIGTFGVAPMFRSSFKEEDTWSDIYNELTTSMGGVPPVEPEEAARKAENGAVLMDVRLAQKYFASACPNSQNFPLYQPISGMSVAANVRRAGFTFFGVFGTERNAEWLQQVEAAIPKDSELILVCDHGGSLKAKEGATTGFQSQSLKAAYFLKRAGYSNVSYMKGGASEYNSEVAALVPGEEAYAA